MAQKNLILLVVAALAVSTLSYAQTASTGITIRLVDDDRHTGSQHQQRVPWRGSFIVLAAGVPITSDMVAAVGAPYNPSSLAIKLTPEGAERLRFLSRLNVGRRLAVLWNGQVVSVADITGEIPSGSMKISGISHENAQGLVNKFDSRLRCASAKNC